jgi:hypothetical protein
LGGLALVLLWAAISSCRHPGAPQAQLNQLMEGVTLAIDAGHHPAPSQRRDIVSIWVIVRNEGAHPVRLRYRDFALSDDSVSDAALLPSELGPGLDAGPLLREGVLAAGVSESGFLYFRLPARKPSSLRVDLEAADETTISRTFVKVRFD